MDENRVGIHTNGVAAVHVTTKVPEVWEFLEEQFDGAPSRVAADGIRTYLLQTAGQWRNVERALIGRDRAGNPVPGAGVQVSVEAFNNPSQSQAARREGRP